MKGIVGKILRLDLGASAPVEVKILTIGITYVLVEYLNSTPGRRETFSKSDLNKLGVII